MMISSEALCKCFTECAQECLPAKIIDIEIELSPLLRQSSFKLTLDDGSRIFYIPRLGLQITKEMLTLVKLHLGLIKPKLKFGFMKKVGNNAR